MRGSLAHFTYGYFFYNLTATNATSLDIAATAYSTTRAAAANHCRCCRNSFSDPDIYVSTLTTKPTSSQLPSVASAPLPR